MEARLTIFFTIAAAYMADLVFDLVPGDAERYAFFPFFDGYGAWDGGMTLQNNVYGYCQHVFLIMIFHYVYLHTGRKFWEYLMWLEVIDMLFYATCYNHTLFELFGHSIEFNYFKFMAVLYFTN